jgi:predicted phosphoribosyltransferase
MRATPPGTTGAVPAPPRAVSRFADRRDAGRYLAAFLEPYRDSAVVLALPRGGVPVGYEIAAALHLALDVIIVRKIGMPEHEEFAVGAIASGGVRVMNADVAPASLPARALESIIARETRELERRERLYRGDRAPVAIEGRTVLLVDDGLATGSTMRAAVLAVRQRSPARIVVAVPVASPRACDAFSDEVDDIVCGLTPASFRAVGEWYVDFHQTTDAEVRDLLAQARTAH